MDPSRLAIIKANAEWRKTEALKILDGGENYDGADGARYMKDIANHVLELIADIEAKQQSGPPSLETTPNH